MSGHIPKAFISDLINKIDIVDVIDSRVTLKKTGANYVACCPFHQEKSPSFTVSPSKQFYHCFGCGEHGTVISFLMAYDKIGYIEAIESLASQAGLVIPYENATFSHTQKANSPDLYQYLLQATHYYQSQLTQDLPAQTYLQTRGLNPPIIERFSLGYAPKNWDNIATQFPSSQWPLLEKIGLVIKHKTGRYYDRFRDRILFPIRDHRGRVLGFGGRTLGSADQENQPKYLNSPETPLFHKGSVLYGLYEAIHATRDLKRMLVVEGYMDVIALAQYDINYAVATMGTAATTQHLERLFRYTSAVIFCFDGDRAGQQAAKRAVETVLPLMKDGRQVKFMFLPAEHDPDSLIRAEGVAAFHSRMDQAKGIGEYVFELLTEGLELNAMDDRASLASVATHLIETIPAGAFRELMMGELAKKTRMNREHFPRQATESTDVPPEYAYEASNYASSSTPRQGVTPSSRQVSRRPTTMRLVMALLLQHPELIEWVPEDLLSLPDSLPGAGLLKKVILLIKSMTLPHTAHLLEAFRDQAEYSVISQLAALPVNIPDDGLVTEFQGAIIALEGVGMDHAIDLFLSKAKETGLSAEEKKSLQALIARRKK